MNGIESHLTQCRRRTFLLGNRWSSLAGGSTDRTSVTTSFHVSALPSGDLQRIRARGTDDFGNAIVGQADSDADGVPLRCCLREAAAGERFALIAWQPADVGGPYAEVGPVFIHADSCDGYPTDNVYPEGFRHRNQLFRAYDRDGWQVDNRLVEGNDAESAIGDLFDRPEVSYVHSRNALPGCYMFTISRADSAA